ncbi:MAG: hypothetical protein JW984_09905 [Deltaproteobacteria bacterium]|uniref:Secretin/TonB short N-terminal domain-containing protein n=1 Tax=Candidatus Zymogenus saltonus TaxID=2844893 RepID=A0A9D8KG99_9DELT|nr:hypothetical protein [Candidatus Zymogenus saltonus]
MKRWTIRIAAFLTIVFTVPSFSISLEEGGDPAFTGKKIDIVMDNADIRKVLLLFGECAGINMVIKGDVKRKITIKLKSVPWDQAFFLLLDIFNLKAEYINDVLIIGKNR